MPPRRVWISRYAGSRRTGPAAVSGSDDVPEGENSLACACVRHMDVALRGDAQAMRSRDADIMMYRVFSTNPPLIMEPCGQ